MAQIINAKMSLFPLPNEVKITVSYDLSFSEHEKLTLSTGSPAMWFSEHIEILGAAENVSLMPVPLQSQSGIIARQRSWKGDRHLLQKGVLPTPLTCRISVVASPASGATAKTNTVVLPNSSVVPYVPLKVLAPAVGAVVGAIALVALLRRR